MDARCFLYYLPGESGMVLKPDAKHRFGLGYAMDDAQIEQCQCDQGPDGKSGMVLSAWGKDKRAHDPRIATGHYKDKQTWRKAPNAEYWLGWYTDAPPAPEDLRHDVRHFVAGHKVQCGDGNDWTIPLARPIVSAPEIPQRLTLTDTGEEWQILDTYRALSEAGERIYVTQATDTEESISYDEAVDLAVLALATNYRVSRVECAALGLFIRPHFDEILLAMIDWPAVRKELAARAVAEKKSAE